MTGRRGSVRSRGVVRGAGGTVYADGRSRFVWSARRMAENRASSRSLRTGAPITTTHPRQIRNGRRAHRHRGQEFARERLLARRRLCDRQEERVWLLSVHVPPYQQSFSRSTGTAITSAPWCEIKRITDLQEKVCRSLRYASLQTRARELSSASGAAKQYDKREAISNGSAPRVERVARSAEHVVPTFMVGGTL